MADAYEASELDRARRMLAELETENQELREKLEEARRQLDGALKAVEVTAANGLTDYQELKRRALRAENELARLAALSGDVCRAELDAMTARAHQEAEKTETTMWDGEVLAVGVGGTSEEAVANALHNASDEVFRLRESLAKAELELDRLKAHQFRAAIEALREKAKTHRSWSPEQPSAYTVAAAWLDSQAPKAEALLPAISPDDERVVDELMSKRAAGLGERSMVPKAEPDAEAEARRRLARNGRVSTSGLTPEQVAFSRAFDELHVEPDGLGWVRREWFEALKRAESGEKP